MKLNSFLILFLFPFPLIPLSLPIYNSMSLSLLVRQPAKMYWPLLVVSSFLVPLAASQGNDTIVAKRGAPAFLGERKYMLDQCPGLEIMGETGSRGQNRPPPQSLAFDCKNPDKPGKITTGALCLNKCLGWDKNTHQFISQKKYVHTLKSV